MIKELIKLANHLDSKGLAKEADTIDLIITKISQNQEISELQREQETERVMETDYRKMPKRQSPVTGGSAGRGCRGGDETPYCLGLWNFSNEITKALKKFPNLYKFTKDQKILGPMEISNIAARLWAAVVPNPNSFNKCFVWSYAGQTVPQCSHLPFKNRGVTFRDIDDLIKDTVPRAKDKFHVGAWSRKDNPNNIINQNLKDQGYDPFAGGGDSDYGKWIREINTLTMASKVIDMSKDGKLSGSIMWDGRNYRD